MLQNIINGKRLTGFILLSIFAALLLTTPLFAQTSNGTIAGVVTDATGAAVVNASVTAKSQATGETRSATTNSVGAYRIESLTPGVYEVTVKAPTFASTVLQNVQVVASTVTSINASVKPGSATETVEVQAAAEMLQTESGEISHTISSAQVVNLPVSGLNPYALATLLPGVVTVQGSVDFTNGTAFSVNGTRARANNYLIEGQDNNDAGIKGQGLQPQNLEAVQEVSFQTSSYSAEFGNGGGSVSNMIYKSGTNQFHGSAWDILRNSALEANDHYNNHPTRQYDKEKFNENIFGFTVGGPVIKNRAFFFVSHQWDRYNSSLQGGSISVPTDAGYAALQGLLTGATPSQAARINTLLSVFSDVRAASTARTLYVGSTAVPVGYTLRTVPDKEKSAEFIVKGDLRLSSKDNVTLRYVRSAGTYPYDFWNQPYQLPGFDVMQYGGAHNAGISYTRTITNNLINEFRVSYGRIGFTFDGRPETYANPMGWSPTTSITGLATFGAPSGRPQGRFHNTMQYQDSISWIKGKHNLKIGFDVADIRVRDMIPMNIYGSIGYGDSNCPASTCGTAVSYSGLANYIDDFGGGGTSVGITFGNNIVRPKMLSQAYFIQDTWKLRSDLTLNWGLRYEYSGAPANVLPYPAVDPNTFGTDDYLKVVKQKADSNNFGPRFGIAYTPRFWRKLFGDDKTVFRAGAGVFYDGIFTNIIDNTAASSPNAVANSLTSSVNASNPRGRANMSTLIPTMTPTPTPLATAQPIMSNLIAPQTYQWNFDIQRELPGSFVLTTGYVGTRGLHLFTTTEANPQVDFGARIFPSRGRIVPRDNQGDSIYHAFDAKLERRLAKGFGALVSYTYSKMIDDASEVFTGGNWSTYPVAQWPTPRGTYDRGLSAFDRRQRLAISYIYEVPRLHAWSNGAGSVVDKVVNGWQISGTTAFQTGTPGNVQIGYDWNGDGISNDRMMNGNPGAPLHNWAVPDSSSPTGYCEGTTWWFVTSAEYCTPVPAGYARFIAPEYGTIGSPYYRNGFTTPGNQSWTFAVNKTFKITERQQLLFRAEFYNPFNHANTGVPTLTEIAGNAWVGSKTHTCAAEPSYAGCGHPDTSQAAQTFGDYSLTQSGFREIRFKLRYSF